MSRLTELIDFYEWNVEDLARGWDMTTQHMEMGEIKEYREYCQRQEDTLNALKKLAHYGELKEQGRLIELPCKVGDSLYKIVYPYRQPPKVTRYKVKNFRTIRKGQKLQIEVQADSSPVKSWMYFDDFYTTKAEAEAKLEEMERANE